ncbi:uncharacterized protein LOC133840174 [Drosophila sulfurigaster albostrigata]|uniref:uncharacterized protein LOC133840174 n=1 Tax=Drosophila sulfurigaster albostrigata TaxID=89887 RepID=UPI002D21A3E2|nr:uncharacterized protein LOC133840174 [Drosophila sulfurigaster albostrigata]
MNNICRLTLLQLLIAASLAKKLVIVWKTFDCVINPDIIPSHRCIIIEPDKNLLTAEIEYNRDFKHYNATFALHLPQPPFNEFTKHFETEIDICEFFRGSYKNKNFIGPAYKSMTRISNMPKGCPQRKGFYYYRNMSIADNIPAFLPRNPIKITLDFYLFKTPILNVTLVGRLAYTTKHKKKP